MSRPNFNGSDLDRLADYAAGVLDHVEAADVSRLIATEPGWRSAYMALVAADAATRRDLHAYAQSHIEPMPGEVAARLDNALAAVAATPVAARTATVVPLAGRHRRRPVLARLVAVAAALVALAGGATVAFNAIGAGSQRDAAPAMGTNSGIHAQSGTGGQAESPESAFAGEQLFAGGPFVIATGSDYRLQTLPNLAKTARSAFDGAAPAAPAPSKAVSPQPGLVSQKIAPSLLRLANPDAMRACLSTVTAAHPGLPTLVDFATFGGAPALIVLLRTSDGRSTVVAVGPSCGLASADERASAPG